MAAVVEDKGCGRDTTRCGPFLVRTKGASPAVTSRLPDKKERTEAPTDVAAVEPVADVPEMAFKTGAGSLLVIAEADAGKSATKRA